MPTLERLQILITADQRRWLENESARRGEPVTSLVREAIDAVRCRRSAAQRRDALHAMEAVWTETPSVVTTLSIDELNRIIDDSRLHDAVDQPRR
jgi:hypothetical protein